MSLIGKRREGGRKGGCFVGERDKEKFCGGEGRRISGRNMDGGKEGIDV